jgi:hypothetical protein
LLTFGTYSGKKEWRLDWNIDVVRGLGCQHVGNSKGTLVLVKQEGSFRPSLSRLLVCRLKLLLYEVQKQTCSTKGLKYSKH